MTTHPVQYQVPWLQALARSAEIELRVFYAQLPDAQAQGAGFGVAFQWDLPLLEGYGHEVVPNRARQPGLDSFWGCHTPTLRARLCHFSPGVVLIHGWHTRTCLQALAAARRLGVPVIIRGESNDLRRRPALVRQAQRLLLVCYSACLAIGKANAAFYLARGVRSKRVFVAPYCVDNERFFQQAEQARLRRDELRARWGIPRDALVPLFCGKLVPKKRPVDLLLAAARAVQAGGRPIHVLMAGDGELRPACSETARACQVPTTFCGFLNQGQIAEAYVAADVLVLPSDSGETWGLVVNEAMACGTPALVSDEVGCHPDLILDGRTGGTFRCGDTSALAAYLSAAAQDRQVLVTWGEEARRHVMEGYGLSQALAGTLAAVTSTQRRRATLGPTSYTPE